MHFSGCRQRTLGFFASCFILFAGVAVLLGIFGQRRRLICQFLQGAIERGALAAKFFEAMRLAKRRVVPGQQGLQGLFRRLLRMQGDYGPKDIVLANRLMQGRAQIPRGLAPPAAYIFKSGFILCQIEVSLRAELCPAEMLSENADFQNTNASLRGRPLLPRFHAALRMRDGCCAALQEHRQEL